MLRYNLLFSDKFYKIFFWYILSLWKLNDFIFVGKKKKKNYNKCEFFVNKSKKFVINELFLWIYVKFGFYKLKYWDIFKWYW